MARKQETPASPADAKDPAATSDSSIGPSDAAGLPLSPGGALVPDVGGSGDSGTPVTDPGPEVSAVPVLQEGLATDSSGTAVVTGGPVDSVQPVLAEGNTEDGINHPAAEEQAQASPNPVTLQIYPMRSYMDEGELRRRGGPAYTVPRRHAEELVQRNLASLEPLRE